MSRGARTRGPQLRTALELLSPATRRELARHEAEVRAAKVAAYRAAIEELSITVRDLQLRILDLEGRPPEGTA